MGRLGKQEGPHLEDLSGYDVLSQLAAVWRYVTRRAGCAHTSTL